MIEIHCAYTQLMPIAKVIPNPRNPNTHPEKQIKLLAKIIEAQGWRAPITVSRRSGFVVRGHGRLEAAQLLGLDEIPVDLQDYESEAAEWADLIADNRLAELAVIDEKALAGILADMDDMLEFTGFSDKEITTMMAGVTLNDVSDDNFDPAEVAEEAKKNTMTMPGDIWMLGNHRLMCGDSTSSEAIKSLLGGGYGRPGIYGSSVQCSV